MPLSGTKMESSPAIAADGSIIIALDNGVVTAYNPDSSVKWSKNVAGGMLGPLVLDPSGNLYVGSQDHKLYALGSDGTTQWTFDTGSGCSQFAPVMSPDHQTVYIAPFDPVLNSSTTGNSVVYSVGVDGKPGWSFDCGTLLACAPSVAADGTIYVGAGLFVAGQSYIIAINPDGTEKWRNTTTFSGIIAAPPWASGRTAPSMSAPVTSKCTPSIPLTALKSWASSFVRAYPCRSHHRCGRHHLLCG